jgi:gas vesicle protein GvpA/GvpJ/GvpM family
VSSGAPAPSLELLEGGENSLLDLVDNLLNQGVVLSGEVLFGLAGVDLIYARLSLVLAAADRVLPKEDLK